VPEQLAQQMIPAGALVTPPLPAPIFRTVRATVCAVVARAVFEYVEKPASLNAWTR
jgi:hypothetical protein